ncbi:MAG: ACP S-malonyltransferase [Alphaproteobacteria bacterium]|nr:ACP S-malonyltransferase [Alphaproteobacteria bacterium]
MVSTAQNTAFMFPGQGSQAVGMGRDLAENFSVARQVFQEIDDALSQKLSHIMWEGPIETLTLTENAQPALMAVSLAAMRVIEQESGKKLAQLAKFVAGHSLGEYSALAASGALPIAETARLLKLRGQAMQQAVATGLGGMAALFPTEQDIAEKIAAEATAKANNDHPSLKNQAVCSIANDNGGGQFVLSGHAVAIDIAVALAEKAGIKRAVKLTVSAPFHCALMAPAAQVMASALAASPMVAPQAILVANVTAQPEKDPSKIRALLVEQVTARVRWRESMAYLAAQNIENLVEIGAGKVLAGLVKKLGPNITASSVGSKADIDNFLKSL